jgi:hypothetical protein
MFAWLKSHFFCFLLLIGERARVSPFGQGV